jgi:prepilin-type N-terminal cleavage/methylation domain-containing protein
VGSNTKGLTLAEVMIALLILSIGLLAIAASSGSVYRMLGRGKMSTEIAHVASSRLEQLRREANKTTPRCTSPGFNSGVDTADVNVIERWTVTGTGATRNVTVVVTVPEGHGPAADTVFALLDCR